MYQGEVFENMFPGYAQAQAVAKVPVEPINDHRLERLREKKEPSLGETNPLVFPPNLTDAQSVDAITFVINEKIHEYQGVKPSLLETFIVPVEKDTINRFVARFEVDYLDEEQVSMLESLVSETYSSAVRTRVDASGKILQPTAYHPLEQSKVVKRGAKGAFGSGFMGWYMGPDIKQTSALHTGLFVYRDIGDTKVADYLRSLNPKDWFFDRNLQTPLRKPLKNRYVIEIREERLYPPDLIALITQTSSIIGKGESIDNPHLIYEIYNDLNRLGLRKAQKENIHGLDEAIKEIERTLILPLANLDLSTGLDLRPGSVLMVGVPGTGKTLVAEYLLQKDAGVFLVPLVPKQLSDDLAKTPQTRTILPRVSEVFRKTGIPVILHLDDVESLGTDNAQINSTLLNLMAGVREHGFYVIASTNHPESLSDQLLQPERFASLIYFGLHDQKSRKGILNIHATAHTLEYGKKLFSSDEQRDLILEALSSDEATQSFTPRFLAEICTQAKTILLQRISRKANQKVGLTELDLQETFTLDDWAQALEIVSREYDKKKIQDWDNKIQEFILKQKKSIGLTREFNKDSRNAFREVYERLSSGN